MKLTPPLFHGFMTWRLITLKDSTVVRHFRSSCQPYSLPLAKPPVLGEVEHETGIRRDHHTVRYFGEMDVAVLGLNLASGKDIPNLSFVYVFI